jgi:hypothetical protein
MLEYSSNTLQRVTNAVYSAAYCSSSNVVAAQLIALTQ